MKRLVAIAWIPLLFLPAIPAQDSADAFYAVALQDLKFSSGEIPTGQYAWNWRDGWAQREHFVPDAALDGPGEAFVSAATNNLWAQGSFGEVFPAAKLSVRAPAGKTVSGKLYLPKIDWSGTVELTFSLDPANAKAEHRSEFFDAKKAYYERLANLDAPGAAWFRHRLSVVKKERGETEPAPAIPTFQDDVQFRRGRQRSGTIEEAFELFSGGRAIAENLQLDRAMPATNESEETVALAEIEGIKIKAFDWKAKLAGKSPKLDALASQIPADQFALFFPSFDAMMTLLDEAERTGTPLLRGIEPVAQDAMTKSRYEKQLCLEMSGLARLLGPQMIEEVAMTASDPYLREGTDVAILFRAKPGMAKVIAEYVRGKQKAAGGAVSLDRSVSSHLFEAGDTVLVSNSAAQVEKLKAVAANSTPALASQDDYKFFRMRYEKGAPEETAFLMLADEAIRKWCSPRWRIAESRRIRALALMSELQAQNMDRLLAGKIVSREKIETTMRALGGGQFHLDPSGVGHSIYGSMQFLTPIAEIALEKVTKQEADLYKRWKQGYESNWSNFFDPIAVRFSVKPEKLGLDVSVYPLILGTEYREMMQVVRQGEATLPPTACDPHPGTLLHYAMSIDPDSEPFREVSKFVIGMAPQLKPNPFQWLGNSAAIFADDDPVWAQIAKDQENYFEKNPIRLPVGIWVEVKNPLALAAFLTGLRSMVNMTAPGMTKWDTIEENGQAYVKITATVDGPRRRNGDEEDDEDAPAGALRPGQMAIYYVTTPKSFLLTLDEGVLKRYLARSAAEPKPNPRPWLGGSYCVQADAKLLETFGEILGNSLKPRTQAASWSNLPILNEWKRLYPDRDPLEVHRQIWGVQLLCAAGGDYSWNAATNSVASSLCGSPRAPKAEGKLPAILQQLRYGNFGVSFEEGGLRARAELERAR